MRWLEGGRMRRLGGSAVSGYVHVRYLACVCCASLVIVSGVWDCAVNGWR